MTEPEQRTPKQDRSRLTRERLLGASIDLLATQGWAATTVGAVAAAAGVSRGAAQHHFPTREDLITAALGHMIEQRIEDVRRVGLDLGEDLVLTRRLGLSLAELAFQLGDAGLLGTARAAASLLHPAQGAGGDRGPLFLDVRIIETPPAQDGALRAGGGRIIFSNDPTCEVRGKGPALRPVGPRALRIRRRRDEAPASIHTDRVSHLSVSTTVSTLGRCRCAACGAESLHTPGPTPLDEGGESRSSIDVPFRNTVAARRIQHPRSINCGQVRRASARPYRREAAG